MDVTSCELLTIFVGSKLIAWTAFETRERKLVNAGSKVGPSVWRSLIISFFLCLKPRVNLDSTLSAGLASNGLKPCVFSMKFFASLEAESFAASNCII